MYCEADYLALSGLQHLCFCARQCALIHIEQTWSENFFTAAGRAEHEKVHSGFTEARRIVRIERDLYISSRYLGIAGHTDAVEFFAGGKIVPVEYKHGAPKADSCDEVQLCAQAMCLEEMLGCKIEEGALFYFKTRHRESVPISAALRAETAKLAEAFHRLVESGDVPCAKYTPKCKSCSLKECCFPESAGKGKCVADYLKRQIGKDISFADL